MIEDWTTVEARKNAKAECLASAIDANTSLVRVS